VTRAELDRLRRDGALLRAVISRDVKLSRSGASWQGLCPFHREKTPSFTVYDDGHFHCFACEVHGDVFEYLMRSKGMNFPRACDEVATEVGIAGPNSKAHADRQNWYPELPVPVDAPRPSEEELRCDMLHEYYDQKDRLLFYVRRHEGQGDQRKHFYPLTYGRLGGKLGWHNKPPPAPRPLYRLNVLSRFPPDATVLLVEGEKAAEAAQRLFLDHVVMTWMGGANGDAKTDFAPLIDRTVILWPDADEPGRRVMNRIAKRLPQARVVETANLPNGYDAADLEAAAGCPNAVAWLNDRVRNPERECKEYESRMTTDGSQAGTDTEPWPDPVDFFADAEITGLPELCERHLPCALYRFVTDTAKRMGVDPASVALASLVTIASVANENWQLQIKQHDSEWTESPRLWGAIIGDPSVLKSPVIRACTKPLDALEIKAREQYDAETEHFKKVKGEWQEKGGDPEEEPEPPVLDRYLVEGTTIEALSEVLRVGHQAKYRAPTGKVLIRQDEMSEWLAGFDRYRAGGRGGSDRGAYLRLYNGGRYTIDRIGRGSFAIANWSACVLGGIQPDPIQRIAQEAVDDGLLQRFIYCVAEGQGEGEDRPPDHDAINH
jgi:hypothetical protein